MGADDAMQCNATKKKDMTGQSFIEQLTTFITTHGIMINGTKEVY